MDPRRELLLVFLLVESAIAMGNISKPLSWFSGIFAVLIVLNHWWNNFDNLKNIFFPISVSKIHYGHMYVAFFACFTAVLVIAGLCNPPAFSLPNLGKRFAVSVLYYLGNALWQQILLNGYFYPRFKQALGNNEAKAILGVGLMFAFVHIPNPVLVPVTLIGGMLCAHFFQKTRNVYVLVIAHAILAVSVMYLLPESWHHHLRIGPGYFLWGR